MNPLIEKNKLSWIYGISTIFIVLNALFIIYEMYWFNLIPFALVIIFLTIYSIDKVLWLIVFATPLAINLDESNLGFAISLPTEPLLVGVLILFMLKLFNNRGFDKRIIGHPVTIAILFNLIWMLITSFTSSMPLVSFKYLIARLWFVIPMYFLGTQLFRQKKNIDKFNWIYIIPLTGVIIYTLTRHMQYGMEEEPAHWVMEPFFNDHTSYGAIMAMFLPFLLFKFLGRKVDFHERFWATALTAVFVLGIIFSYTRAAWLSLVIAFLVYLIFLFKVKLRTIGIFILGVIITFFVFQEKLLMKLEKNRQDSSDNLAEHVQSISNISSDASNLERLNRWSSAFRMFEERPFFGWGPGTYMFKYAPYQLSSEKTIISTNSADGGNAHSEYIGPLAESGVLGSLSFIIIIITISLTAYNVYHNSGNQSVKVMVLSTYLGLVTYVVHGGLNNFLDTDKASIPFWGFTAMIVALDVYHRDSKKPAGE